MKNKITLLFFSLVLLILIPLYPKSQTVCNNYWAQVDSSFSSGGGGTSQGIFPFSVDISGSTPVAPLYKNDDGYGTLTLPFSFCFYGTYINQVYFDNNGFMTWGANASNIYSTSSSYQPTPFPLTAGNPPMIAPFWADVYTRSPCAGLVWYKVTPTYLIIQWDSVGGFGGNSSQDDNFQIIITNGSDPIVPFGNNIEVSYGEMQWAVGTASGGTGGFGGAYADPAIAGINEGNGTGSVEFGAFSTATSNYTSPYPSSPYDGVYWLDGKTFFLNSCTGNAPPFEVYGPAPCDTFKICEGDTVKVSYLFYSVITGYPITTVLASPVPTGVSIIYNNQYTSTDSISDSVVVQIVGSNLNAGINIIGLYSFDNLSPADTLYTPIIIDVSPSPSVTISAVPDTICLGSTTVLTAGGGLTYLWSTGGTTSSITVTPIATETYSVAIATSGCTKDTEITVRVDPPINLSESPISPAACLGSPPVTITASGASSYTWAPNTGLSCYTCSSVVASPSVTTVYTITGTANGCSAVITDTVKVFPAPVVTVTVSPDSICTGDSVQLTASSTVAGTTYLWSPSIGLSCTTCSNPYAKPTGTTVYTATGTDADGCSAFASVSVFVSPLPALSVSPNMSICPGKTVTLYASGNGITYTWSPGGETGPSLTVTPAYTQTYTVTMTSGCGSLSATVTVTVNPQPIPSFYSNINAGCVPLCTQFHNTSTIASGFIATTSWSFGTGDTSNANNPIYCFQNAGAYSIILTTTSDSGCSSTLSVNDLINVYNHPNPAFTASPQPTTMLQPTVNFTNNSTDAYGIIGWNWTFGDATDSTAYSQNAIHTYQDTGTYCATLTVTNLHGCTDSVTNCIVISPDYCLYIPDAFSPNGDGVNDVFKVVGNDVKSFEMYIFDRWGLQLFHTTDISTGWNGTKAGGICQEDAYVYLINVYDTKDKKHAYMGTLQLIK